MSEASPFPPPSCPTCTPLTSALSRQAQQVLHGLQQLVLLELQEVGVAAGSTQAALEVGEGAVLAAQQAPQLLLLPAEVGQLGLLLCLQRFHPHLQCAAGRGEAGRTEVSLPSPAGSHACTLPPGPQGESALQTCAEAQRGRASSSGLQSPRSVAQNEDWRKE